VAVAVERLGGDASKVWSRNVRLLEAMERRWGRRAVETAMKGEGGQDMSDLLKEDALLGYKDESPDARPNIPRSK